MEQTKKKLYFAFFTLGIIIVTISIVTFVTSYGLLEKNEQLRVEVVEIASTMARLEHLTATIHYIGNKHIFSENEKEKEKCKRDLGIIYRELDELIEDIVSSLKYLDEPFYEQLQIKWEFFFRNFYMGIHLIDQHDDETAQILFLKANDVFELLNTEHLLPLYYMVQQFISDHVTIQNKNSQNLLVAQIFTTLLTITCFLITWYYLTIIIKNSEKLSERLHFFAFHDELTKLPNRRSFRKRVNEIIQKNNHFAIMFLDINKFKSINDRYGHDIGDLVIRNFAKRVKGCIDDKNIMGRNGGDEFTILLNEMEEDEVLSVAKNIIQSLDRPIYVEGKELFVSTSIGIAFYPVHGKDYKTLLKHADEALYKAKHDENGYVVYGK